MKRIFFCLLLVNSFSASGQSLKWYDGSIVLTSGQVIVGRMVIDPLLDVVLIEHNMQRAVYSAHKVRSVYYYDDFSDINRRFVSLKDESPFYNQSSLFEVVVSGDVKVLRRQKTKGSSPSDATDFSYYVMYRGDVVSLNKFKKKVYPSMKSSMDGLGEFVSMNHLFADNDSNAIKIIEHYNRCLRAGMVTAKH